MSYAQAVQIILEYIDKNLQEEITTEVLAQKAGFSLYHFCRVFRWETGYAVMEYVRRRRLAFAAAELASPQKIIDIALKYGFETHAGFSKAFKRVYACTPEAYRRHSVSRAPEVPLMFIKEKYTIGGLVMEPKFVTKPAIQLAGYAIVTRAEGKQNTKDIPLFWEEYMTDGRMENLHREGFVKNHAEYGACFPEDVESGDFKYIIGVESKEGAEIKPQYDVAVLPPATYAVFSTPASIASNFVANIQGTWSFVFNEWFPNSGYEYADGAVDFELYDDRCMNENGKVCEIYIPVQKASK